VSKLGFRKEKKHENKTPSGRRKRKGDDTKHITNPENIAMRKCLRCDQLFKSKNKYNRVCYSCTHLEDYQYIGDLYSTK
jgi:hypothetical protein